jgi:hypothetical protein
MRRLACAALLIACDPTVYPPFAGEGGVNGGSTVIGGMSHADLSVPPDLSLLASSPSGTITVRSATTSQVIADFTTTTCVATTVGGCLLRDCPPGDMAVAAFTPDVGIIHVVAPMGDVMLSPQSNGTYLPLTVANQLWTAAGASITVAGSGADFPAFSIMLGAPTAVTVVNPLSGSFDLPRNSDFAVSWSGGSAGHVTVEVAAGSKRLDCDFAVAAGNGSLPTAGLTALPAGTATMTITVDSTATVDNVILVSAEVAALDSTGQPFTATVNLR